MNRAFAATVLGLGAGAAVTLAVHALRPTEPSLAVLHRRVHALRSGVSAASPTGAASLHGRWAERAARSGLGARLAERFGGDLLVAQATLPDLVAQLVVFAVTGFLVGIAAVGSLAAAGAHVAPAFGAVAGLLGAAAAVALALANVRSRGARGRAEFRDAVSQYLTLCASVMAAGRSAEWAVRYAAGAGRGRAFETIEGALSTAPAMGRTTWDALAAVAGEWGVAELGDLAAAVERATTLGGDAAESAGVIAQAMRARSLDDVERAADRANVAMLGPTYLFLGGFCLFLAFPLLDELSRSL